MTWTWLNDQNNSLKNISASQNPLFMNNNYEILSRQRNFYITFKRSYVLKQKTHTHIKKVSVRAIIFLFRTKKDLVVLPSTNIKILEKNAPSFLGKPSCDLPNKKPNIHSVLFVSVKKWWIVNKKHFHTYAYTHNQRITSMVLP